MFAVYHALRARALAMLRRRATPVWDDPLHPHCPRLVYSDQRAPGRIWVIAAHERQDLVRAALAELSGRPRAQRPHLIIVACDPASREDLAIRAQDWRSIFDVGFEVWLPDEPPAPAHLASFCLRLTHRNAVLLSPAEALFAQPDWVDDAFRFSHCSSTQPIECSPGDVNLNLADRVPVLVWRQGAATERSGAAAFSPVRMGPAPAAWAPITIARLPALTSQVGGFRVQGWLYRHQGLILDIAAWMLLLAGLPRPPANVEVTACFAIPDVGLFLAGSIIDPVRAIKRIAVKRWSDGGEIDLSAFWSRVPEPKLDRLYRQYHVPQSPRGFVALIPISAFGTTVPTPVLDLDVLYQDNRCRRRRIPVSPLTPGVESVRTLLAAFSPDRIRLREFMLRQVAQPVERLWRAPNQGRPRLGAGSDTGSDTVRPDVVCRIGALGDAPRVSIIIPVYGRWDFMRYQMESFRKDSSLRDVEWIYVLDDPRIATEMIASAEALHAVFGIAFTLLYPQRNLGFSGACNRGAAAARGDLLLLMNSDVFAVGDGWIEPMLDALHDDVAAVGARLLYEDHAVQHAGVALEPFGPWDDLCILTHPGKGLPDRLLPAVPRASAGAGATAACLLLRRADYEGLGGLCEDFVIGDFEDGDLCARLRRAGQRTVITAEARLYHLERQSIGSMNEAGQHGMLTLYNCWLFNRRIDADVRGCSLHRQAAAKAD